MTHETAVSTDDDTEAEARATARALFGGPATTTTDDGDRDDAHNDARSIFHA